MVIMVRSTRWIRSTEEKKKIEQIDKKEKKKKKPIRTEKGEIGEEGVEGNLNLKNGRQFSEIAFYDDIMNVNNSDFNFNSFCTANNFFSHREDLNDEIINSGYRKEDDRVHSSHSSNKVYLTNSNRNYHRDDNKNDNNNGNKYSKNGSQNKSKEKLSNVKEWFRKEKETKHN